MPRSRATQRTPSPSSFARFAGSLKRAAPFLRGRLAREVTLKFTPALTFELDRSFAEAERIETLLRETRDDLPDDGT